MNAKKSYGLFDIAFDKQNLLRHAQLSCAWKTEQNIQSIEKKYFEYMTYFSFLYPKPFFISEQINWCAYFLDMIYLFKLYFEKN